MFTNKNMNNIITLQSVQKHIVKNQKSSVRKPAGLFLLPKTGRKEAYGKDDSGKNAGTSRYGYFRSRKI